MKGDAILFPFNSIVYRRNSEVAGIFNRIIYNANWYAVYEIKWPDGSCEECDPGQLQLEKPYGMAQIDHDED